MNDSVKKQCLTVVVPCFNERDNIDYLIAGFISADSQGRMSNVIFVDDDSPDGSSEYIKNLEVDSFHVSCIRRVGRTGLSSAVIEGILLADSEYVAVMDGDGQHDPIDLISMFGRMQLEGHQFIIGSRFIDESLVQGHSGFRYVISKIGIRISNNILGRSLTDPLTGFFIFKRSIFIESIRGIRPTGFKILLELLYLLKNVNISVVEHPIAFKSRFSGKSKLDTMVILEFVEQMLGFMTKGLFPVNFLGFALVGASGIAFHFAVLSLLYFIIDRSFLFSQFAATFAAIVFNFYLNNQLTFRKSRLNDKDWFKGCRNFIFICSIGAIVNIGVADYLFGHQVPWWLAALFGIGAGGIFNFSLAKNYVWKR
jgi:dolichol-phosphate mannosyltransferase